jgi:hypothetical protein
LARDDRQKAEQRGVERSDDGDDETADLVVPDEVDLAEFTVDVPLSEARSVTAVVATETSSQTALILAKISGRERAVAAAAAQLAAAYAPASVGQLDLREGSALCGSRKARPPSRKERMVRFAWRVGPWQSNQSGKHAVSPRCLDAGLAAPARSMP